MAKSNLIITQSEGVTVATLRLASLIDGPMIEAVGSELNAIVDDQAVKKLIVDFRAVGFLSSQMISVLVSLHKKSKSIGGLVVLAGMRPNLKKVFEITKLDKLLVFAKDEKDAMTKFKW